MGLSKLFHPYSYKYSTFLKNSIHCKPSKQTELWIEIIEVIGS